jgi:hypothetical protein
MFWILPAGPVWRKASMGRDNKYRRDVGSPQGRGVSIGDRVRRFFVGGKSRCVHAEVDRRLGHGQGGTGSSRESARCLILRDHGREEGGHGHLVMGHDPHELRKRSGQVSEDSHSPRHHDAKSPAKLLGHSSKPVCEVPSRHPKPTNQYRCIGNTQRASAGSHTLAFPNLGEKKKYQCISILRSPTIGVLDLRLRRVALIPIK